MACEHRYLVVQSTEAPERMQYYLQSCSFYSLVLRCLDSETEGLLCLIGSPSATHLDNGVFSNVSVTKKCVHQYIEICVL